MSDRLEPTGACYTCVHCENIRGRYFCGRQKISYERAHKIRPCQRYKHREHDKPRATGEQREHKCIDCVSATVDGMCL